MFRIAMLSKWHVHGKRYVHELSTIPEAKITCVWDEVPERGAQWAAELNCDFEPQLDVTLARKDVDGVVITAPTNKHKEVIIAAAKAGKHIFIEKTFTLTVSEALEAKKAVEEAKVKFCIVFPRRSNPEFAYGRMLYNKGELGEISLLRIRNGIYVTSKSTLPAYWFKKEQTGGGAMMDLGCHPIYLAYWILGEPESINSTFTHIFNREVEDAAVCTIRFKNKGIAIVESTYNAPAFSTYNFEIYGTKGTYLAIDGCEKVSLKREDGKVEYLDVSSMPAFDPLPMKQWVDACNGQGEIHCGIDEAVMLVRIMEAAYKAAEENRTVNI